MLCTPKWLGAKQLQSADFFLKFQFTLPGEKNFADVPFHLPQHDFADSVWGVMILRCQVKASQDASTGVGWGMLESQAERSGNKKIGGARLANPQTGKKMGMV